MIVMMFNPILRNNRMLLQAHHPFTCGYCGVEARACYQRRLDSTIMSAELHRDVSPRGCSGLFKGRVMQVDHISDEEIRGLHEYYPRSILAEIVSVDDDVRWSRNPANTMVNGNVQRFTFGPILGLCCTNPGCNTPITEGLILLSLQPEILCPAHMPPTTIAPWRTFCLRDGDLYTLTGGYHSLYRHTANSRPVSVDRAARSMSYSLTSDNTGIAANIPWRTV